MRCGCCLPLGIGEDLRVVVFGEEEREWEGERRIDLISWDWEDWWCGGAVRLAGSSFRWKLAASSGRTHAFSLKVGLRVVTVQRSVSRGENHEFVVVRVGGDSGKGKCRW